MFLHEEAWYSGQAPTRDFLNWDGQKYHKQKSPKHYLCKKQNPVPKSGDTLSPKVGTVAAPKGISDQKSVPKSGDIQHQEPVPKTGDITSLTTPKRSEGMMRMKIENGTLVLGVSVLVYRAV
jgi:hypothetical protein